MRGLMIKDMRLLFQRKQSFLILLLVAFFMGFNMDGGFVIGYMTFLSVIFASSAIAYDEQDNGYLFLMSLPIDARTYVLEKYIFSFFLTAAAWVTGILLTFILTAVRRIPWDVGGIEPFGVAFTLSIALILMAVCLFLYIKFGSTKGGMVLAVLAGVFAAFITVISKTGPAVLLLVKKINEQPMWVLLAISFTLGILLFLLSAFASIRVMEKREF